MSVSFIRYFLCWVMIIALPVSLLAQDASSGQGQAAQGPSAILHTMGGVWVNGEEARDATAVAPGDLVETKTGFTATLSLDGTQILLQQEGVAKFDGDLLELDHGSVAVGTSKGFKVRVNCITVIPVLNDWTQYEVSDTSGTVHVAARKKDVYVREGNRGKASDKVDESYKSTVREGEESNRDESQLCGAGERTPTGRLPVDPKWIAAGAGGTGLLLWLLLHGGGSGGSSQPISPDTPGSP
jgi:hypothetical protein